MVTEAPTARQADLLTEEVHDELIVFDTRDNDAHALDADATAVWRACDGRRSPAQIAEHCQLDEAVVEQTLACLAACRLLEPADNAAVSRRAMLRRVALTGAAVGAGLPIVSSIVVPNAAAAASLSIGNFSNGGSWGGSGPPTTESPRNPRRDHHRGHHQHPSGGYGSYSSYGPSSE